jgi:hypothetical protein
VSQPDAGTKWSYSMPIIPPYQAGIAAASQ